MERQLFVDKVSMMDLFVTPKCEKCSEQTIHGFWQQLRRFLEPGKDRVSVYLPCQKCGHVKRRRYKLVEKENFTPREEPSFTEMAKRLEWSNKGCCRHCAESQANGHKSDCRFVNDILPFALHMDEKSK